ncbi:Uncharacterised protein [Mycolicibacterium flavescens]|uniref:terminase n=1 Tax=Mycobacterium neumannii TaxID=2048551 RepID=UPI000B943C66|nr:terminase [Mycobacterium neumannii]VEG42732.1 Uncharacterised protein [Mycolicibacterium flavescens]
MPSKQSPPPVPAGLTGSGLSLWTSTVATFELDQHELALLCEACRTADSIDKLQAVVDRDGVLNTSPQGVRAHPALVELRQQRLAFTKLVAALAIPSDDIGAGSQRPRTGLRAVK